MPNGKNGKNKKVTLTLFWISIVLLLAVVGLAIWGLIMAGRRESFNGSSPCNCVVEPCCCNMGKNSYCTNENDRENCHNNGGTLLCMTSSKSPKPKKRVRFAQEEKIL